MAEPERRPAPLSEFLDELRARGISIGIREHYEVAWLLTRWPEDLTTLRHALGSILGTDPEEAKLVRATFDELYPSSWSSSEEVRRLLVPVLAETPEQEGAVGAELDELWRDLEEEKPPPPPPELPRWRRLLERYWPGLVLAAALAVGFGYLAWPEPPPPPPQVVEPPPPVEPEPFEPEEPVEPEPEVEPPPPPQLERLAESLPPPPPMPNWSRGAATGGALALGLFAWLYWARTGREARRAGYGELALELDHLDDPQVYQLNLGDAAPPFDGGLLDDVGMLLARQASVAEARSELDIDRSLESTLDAGLAPSLVFATRTSAEPVLILEDVSVEMRPYRPLTRGLIAALKARGVYFEHWRFDGDARELFFGDTGLMIGLERLIRQRTASALLILSSGSGILDAESGERAEWIGQLHFWLSRAWLHPNPDPGLWRRAVHELPLPVWPLNADGLMSAARHLATGETDARTAELTVLKPSPPVKPLHVSRLRRLLDLAPRRDPELAELLRQEFCPTVPAAAIPEAVAAPPLAHPPALGPSDEEVREFLIEVLDKSRPPAGSGAELRWRLDRALQAIHLPDRREAALAELEALAAGPLAAEVAAAVERGRDEEAGPGALAAAAWAGLESRVLVPVAERAERAGRVSERAPGERQWKLPRPVEVVVPLLLFAAVWIATPWLGPWFNAAPPPAVEIYSLAVSHPEGDPLTGPFVLEVGPTEAGPGSGWELYRQEGAEVVALVLDEEPPPDDAQVLGQGSVSGIGDTGAVLELGEDQRGYWYWVAEELPTGNLGLSNPVWVGTLAKGGLRVTFSDSRTGADLGALEYSVARPPPAQVPGEIERPWLFGDEILATGGDEVELTAGAWIVQAEVDGYAPTSRTVQIPPRQTVELPLALEPSTTAAATGTLRPQFFDQEGRSLARVVRGYSVFPVENPEQSFRGVPARDLELAPGTYVVNQVDLIDSRGVLRPEPFEVRAGARAQPKILIERPAATVGFLELVPPEGMFTRKGSAYSIPAIDGEILSGGGPVELEPGRHEVYIDSHRIRRVVNIEAGETTVLDLARELGELENIALLTDRGGTPLNGVLRIENYPAGASPGRLSFDGERWDGSNPMVKRRGPLQLAFQGGTRSFEETLEIPAGRELVWEFQMPDRPPTFKAFSGDGVCPAGYTLAEEALVRRHTQDACAALGTWYIARLANGGAMDGSGYGCKIRGSDERDLGHSLCREDEAAAATPPPVSTKVAASYQRMDFGFNRCQVEWDDQRTDVSLQTMVELATAAGAEGFTYHPELRRGALLKGSYPSDCASDAGFSWPLYLDIGKAPWAASRVRPDPAQGKKPKAREG